MWFWIGEARRDMDMEQNSRSPNECKGLSSSESIHSNAPTRRKVGHCNCHCREESRVIVYSTVIR